MGPAWVKRLSVTVAHSDSHIYEHQNMDRAVFISGRWPSLCTFKRVHGSFLWCLNTDYVHVNGHDRTITVILAKHCIKLPDDGSLVIRNMEKF